jgi:hypothetical protein
MLSTGLHFASESTGVLTAPDVDTQNLFVTKHRIQRREISVAVDGDVPGSRSKTVARHLIRPPAGGIHDDNSTLEQRAATKQDRNIPTNTRVEMLTCDDDHSTPGLASCKTLRMGLPPAPNAKNTVTTTPQTRVYRSLRSRTLLDQIRPHGLGGTKWQTSCIERRRANIAAAMNIVI